MSAFGFFPSEQTRGPLSPPPGYGAAKVHLGDVVETVFCSLAIWNVGDYVAHWRHGASKCLQERQAFLFCTDLTDQTACVFAAFPEDSGYLFEEWIMPHVAFTVGAREIVPVSQDDMVRSGDDTSSWWVDEAAIADFVKAT